MATDYRALCIELLDAWDNAPEFDLSGVDQAMDRARAALAQPEPQEPTGLHAADPVPADELLAAYRAGAADAALAQPEPVRPSMLRTERRDGPWGEWNALIPQPAPTPMRTVEQDGRSYLVPEQKEPEPAADREVAELVALIRQIALAWEPDACLLGNMTAGRLARAADLLERLAQPEPVGPTDDEIMELMPQQMHEDLAAAARALAEQASTISRSATGVMRIMLNRHAVDLARAVLQRWGRPAITPIPPDRVPLPQNEEQAAGMANIGLAWLKQHSSDRLRHPGLAPTPVSERLPGAEDCAPWPDEPGANHWCWLGQKDEGGWHWTQVSAMGKEADELEWSLAGGGWTHWLPAHALPLPTTDG